MKSETNATRAFTLIEMVIALAIIALLAVVAVPTLMQRSPQYERKQFIQKLNSLTQFAWQHAITTGKVHRLLFDMRKRTIVIQESQSKKDVYGKPLFKTVKNSYVRTEYVWPASIMVQSVFIDGKDPLQIFDEAYELWFYLVPSGIAQDVILNFNDKNDTLAGRPRQFSVVLNPFTAQFKAYDTFQKP